MKTFKLYNGVEMPELGYGVFQVPAVGETKKAVLEALKVGYRHIDTAAAYQNEREVGEAIRESGIPREEIFVTSKLWIQDFGYENALKGFEHSLNELGLDYIDLYLLHKPFNDYYGAWRALEKLYKEGKIRAIGVTSFTDDRLMDLILNTEIKPMVNQVETNVFRQQKETEAFLKEQGILMEAWAPFAEGNNDIFNNPILKEIADKHHVSTGQVQLKWLNQRGISAIPKSVHKERMIQNLESLNFTLDQEDMDKIASIDTGISTIQDERDINTIKGILSYKIHD